MVKMGKYSLFLIIGLVFYAAFAQNTNSASTGDAKVIIRAVAGKDGKVLANRRLLVFGGEMEDSPRFHDVTFSVQTDKEGIARLGLDPTKVKWIQVWADGLTLCQNKPNLNSFQVMLIVTTGASAPNTCGTMAVTPTPGEFTMFARPSSLREKVGR